jgi:DNA polymerase III epsilon subunit-like protein
MSILKKPVTPDFGLVIDWETSGATWGGDSSKDYQGLSFGAIVFNALTFEPVESLYVEIKLNPKWKWSAEAEAIHGLSQEYLEKNGISQEDAAIKLAELIMKYWGPDGKVMFMGHNAEFDRRFTNQLLNQIEIEFSVEKQTQFTSWIQLHHVILDTSPIGFVTMGLFKSDLLFEKMGFEQRGKHNALQDAEQTLATARGIRGLVNIALEQL